MLSNNMEKEGKVVDDYKTTHEYETGVCVCCRRPECGYGPNKRLCELCYKLGPEEHILGTKIIEQFDIPLIERIP
jgi:hypothetical protein